jgi:hypothetical protein
MEVLGTIEIIVFYINTDFPNEFLSLKNTNTLFFRFTFLVFYFCDNYFVGKAYIVKEQYF